MRKIYAAFLHSMAGLSHGVRTERAIGLEFALLLAGVPLAFLVGATGWERLALILSLLAVLCVEFLNTAVEKLCDHVRPEQHPAIKAIKDMASAACFCAQGSAALIWLFALWGRLMG